MFSGFGTISSLAALSPPAGWHGNDKVQTEIVFDFPKPSFAFFFIERDIGQMTGCEHYFVYHLVSARFALSKIPSEMEATPR